MKYLNSLIIASLILVSSLTARAVDASTNLVGSGVFSLVQNSLHLTSLEIVNNHPTAAATVTFYDSPLTNLTYVVGAYTNTLTYTTNIVITTTDYYLNKTTNTNAAVYSVLNAVGQATNSYRLFKSLSVAAGGTSTWVPAGGVYNSFGLTANASATNVTVNYIYSNLR